MLESFFFPCFSVWLCILSLLWKLWSCWGPSAFLTGQLHGEAGLWVALQMVRGPVQGVVTPRCWEPQLGWSWHSTGRGGMGQYQGWCHSPSEKGTECTKTPLPFAHRQQLFSFPKHSVKGRGPSQTQVATQQTGG